MKGDFMVHTIKLVALDMDGTLLDRSSRLTDFTIDTLRSAQRAGITVAICTGRYLENVQVMLQDAGIACPIIALNGGTVQAGEQRVHTAFMPQGTVRRLYEAFEQTNASYYLFGEKSVVTRRSGQRHHSEISYARRLEGDFGVRFAVGKEAAEAASHKRQFKFYVYQDFESCTVDAALAAIRDISGIACTRSSDHNFEVMPAGVDKGTGLYQLAQHFCIPMQAVMAVGDQENDIPMLNVAGLSVAMGNASDKAKAAADAVTQSNAEDGAAKAIIRFALQPASNG